MPGGETTSVLQWLQAWERTIRDNDFAAARRLFDDDVVSFGTFAVVARGLDALEAEQWRRTWPHIAQFRFDHDTAVLALSPDGFLATLAVTWSSEGADTERRSYHRPGRASVVLRRGSTTDPWRGVHTHFSLNRGVPTTAGHLSSAGEPDGPTCRSRLTQR